MVKSLAAQERRRSALSYPDTICKVLREGDTFCHSLLAKKFSYNTMFSGMATPEVAIGMICRRIGCVAAELSSCDKDKQSQQILKAQGHPNACLYADVCDLAQGRPKDLARHQNGDWPSAVTRFVQNLRLRKSVQCLKHLRKCENAKADLTVLGSPCTDFSSIGIQQGVGGETAWPTLVSFASSRTSPIVIHENVMRFPSQLFNSAFQDKYAIFEIRARPSDMGFSCIRRPRVYRVAVDRRLKLLASPVDLYNKVSHAVAACERMTLADALHDRGPPCKLKRLTLKQQGYFKDFVRLWRARHRGKLRVRGQPAVFHLGDNPLQRRVCSDHAQLPTLRAGMSRLVIGSARPPREITANELLLTMGWPTQTALGTVAGTAAADVASVLKVCGRLTQRQVLKKLGNSMHLAVVTAVIGCALAAVDANSMQTLKAASVLFQSHVKPFTQRHQAGSAVEATPTRKRAAKTHTDEEEPPCCLVLIPCALLTFVCAQKMGLK
jgi:site-specific DNA-cytosine methylase